METPRIDKFFEAFMKETLSLLKDMSKAKNAKEKLAYSQAIKNLFEGVEAYVSSIREMLEVEKELLYGEDDDFDEFDDDYDDEE